MSDGSKRSRRYRDPQIRKQVSVFLPAPEWRALRDEAARQRLPLTELCRRSIRTSMDRLRQTPAADPSCDPRQPPAAPRGSSLEE
jgi:hypothetical protein